ncbi:MAG: hypothetical protein ABIF12_00080 [bacterium]
MKILKYLFLFLVLLSGCGKKQKNIFDFYDKKVVSKVNKFNLGFIKGTNAKNTVSGNLITWNFLDISSEYKKSFVGFNVYRLVRSSLIPKKALNKKPLIQNQFLDKEILSLSSELKQESYCYAVRSVFFIEDKFVFGAISQIVCTN